MANNPDISEEKENAVAMTNIAQIIWAAINASANKKYLGGDLE